MADRRRQTVLLIYSRDDWRWFPAIASAAAGFVPQHHRTCPACHGSGRAGWLRDRFGRWLPCVRCGGAVVPSARDGGFQHHDGGSGRVAFDPMDSLGRDVGSEGSGVAASRPRQVVRCDACNGDGVHGNGQRCRVCDGTGRRDLHAFELRLDVRDVAERDPLADSVDRRIDLGSYLELDQALDWLRRQDRAGHRLLLEQVDARRRLTVPAEAALGLVVERMPEPIRVPAVIRLNDWELRRRRTLAHGRGAGRRLLSERDREVRKLVRDGHPVQWVAREFELGVSTVYGIVRAGVAAGSALTGAGVGG